ncbi:MAG: membrane protein insertase YidC [Bacteroidia bacterium]|nr:membrane protein insertase YidC [Bacteroidia bacterium]NNM15324.1 membrane protein insertase YidC [Bacteroidia bacterium]
MDRNSFIGLLLIGLILIGYSYLNRPTPEQQAEFQRKRDSIAAVELQALQDQKIRESLEANSKQIAPQVEKEVLPDSIKDIVAQQELGSLYKAGTGTERLIKIENDTLALWINTLGGKIARAELKGYKKHNGDPLILLNSDTSEFGIQFYNSTNRDINTNNLYFTTESNGFSVSGDNKETISLKLKVDENKYIEYVYGLNGSSYLIDFDFNVVGMQNEIASNSTRFDLKWKTVLKQQEKSFENERNVSTVYYNYKDDDVDYLSETKPDEESLKSKIKWFSFKQQFFSTALIADEHFNSAEIKTEYDEDSEDYLKITEARVTIPYRHAPVENFGMQFYIGPNHYQTLKALDLKMERQIPLGWAIFRWINQLVIIPLFNFFDNYIANYGIIILILTVIIKATLMPLTYKSYLSQARMKVLKPEVEEIQAKFKGGDQMKQQQETMALYRKAGVNPMGGCIPMLFQMPILFAMFRFFPASIELRQKAFLWADDLSTYDSIYDFPGGFEIPFYGDHISLFTLLMSISTVMYTMVNQQMTMSTNPQMKWMMYLMPIMFLGFFNNYSAGLSYYYFLANIFTFFQSLVFRGLIDEDAIHKKVQERKKKAKPVKKSKFQERLEKMAKERGYQPPKRK